MKILPPNDLPTIYLKPGEMHFGTTPARVVTVLGSCVSIIMYHRPSQTGAICHAVMPSSDARTSRRGTSKDAFQYVDSALEWMLEHFRKMGIRMNAIEVMIFGGS